MFGKFRAQVKGIFDARLPFEILEEGRPLEQKYLKEKGTRFPIVNDNRAVIDLKIKQAAIIYLLIALVTIVVFVAFGIVMINSQHHNATISDFVWHPAIFIILLLSVLAAIYYSREIYVNRHEAITLDRENGLITFPVGLRKNKVYTSPFHKIKIHWYGTGGATGNLDMKLVANHPDKKGGAFLEGLDSNYRKLWSFYVWYMDKNRPLPPGSAFDPYREADFERRKAEGFPRPLYRSHIPTPEATPGQQAERDKHWKDQLEEFTREPESVMYDPEIHKNWLEVRYTNQNREPFANVYLRFEFENGDIIYMKTDENGSGHQPPETEKHSKSRMELFESWF